MLESLLKGIAVGAGAAIPLGPVGIMCIQKTLSKGRLSGYLTGAGASLADTLYALLATLSMAIVRSIITEYETIVLFAGGFIIIGFGLKIFFTNPVKQIRKRIYDNQKLLEDAIPSFVMDLTNPGTLFLILGLFAFVGLDVGEEPSLLIVFAATGGVLVGANIWWFILSTAINTFRNKIKLRQLVWINRIAGTIVMAVGLLSSAEATWRWLRQLLDI